MAQIFFFSADEFKKSWPWRFTREPFSQSPSTWKTSWSNNKKLQLHIFYTIILNCCLLYLKRCKFYNEVYKMTFYCSSKDKFLYKFPKLKNTITPSKKTAIHVHDNHSKVFWQRKQFRGTHDKKEKSQFWIHHWPLKSIWRMAETLSVECIIIHWVNVNTIRNALRGRQIFFGHQLIYASITKF